MQLDLLKKRAQKIPNVQESNNRVTEVRIVPSWRFSCNGLLTGVFVGVDIRRNILSGGGARTLTMYPSVQVWNGPSVVLNEEIRFEVGDFSPAGVLQYNLSNPFPIQNRFVLSVSQQLDSTNNVVRLYYESASNAPPTQHYQSLSSFPPLETVTNQFILISPITSGIITKYYDCVLTIMIFLSLFRPCLCYKSKFKFP